MFPGRLVSLEPAELELLCRAFDRACETLRLRGSRDLEDLALIVLTAYERGVTEADDLVAYALDVRNARLCA